MRNNGNVYPLLLSSTALEFLSLDFTAVHRCEVDFFFASVPTKELPRSASFTGLGFDQVLRVRFQNWIRFQIR